MDQAILVSYQLDDGQRLIEQLSRNGMPVAGAFWLKANQETRWYFYVITSMVDKDGIHAAYRRLVEVVQKMPQPFWIDPLEVKLIGPSDAQAKDVQAVVRGKLPGRPFRYGDIWLGGQVIDDAFLYAPPTVAASAS